MSPNPGILLDHGSEQPYVAPRNEVEALVEILAAVLGIVDAGKLGVQHNFFDLGGHSMQGGSDRLATARSFGVELPLRSIFEHTTVEAPGQSGDRGPIGPTVDDETAGCTLR